MICPYCGKENSIEATSCFFCGGPLLVPEQKESIKTIPQETADVIDRPVTQPEIPAQASPQTPYPSSGNGWRDKIGWFVGCIVFVCLALSCAALVWGSKRLSGSLGFLQAPTLTPTLTSTPYPTATLIPTATNTPIPSISTPGLLYFDDFSDPNSGWDSVNEVDFVTDYYNNAYRIIQNSAMADSWSNPTNLSYTDVAIEVDATKNGGPDDNDFGLICRYKSVDEFYFGVISSDGYYGISKMTSDGSSLLGREDLAFSEYINQGFTTNHLRFDCIGDVMTLSVNGHQLDQQTDNQYTSGNVGLLAGTYDTPGTDILFDNFSVLQP
jgi:hypothetical protein